ncbi:choice-of-anchor D domain-containing protein [bacterium SCSIO 12696]|nr:choice-of-anchor D domain-containing protein [bacterium SCSIO 12696]
MSFITQWLKRHFIWVCTIIVPVTTQADTLLYDDFQDGNANGWSFSGSGYGYVSYYAGNYSLRLSKSRQAQTSLSTQGYSNVSISIDMAAASLEGSDRCLGEVSVNGGATWQTVVEVVNGQDNGVTLYNGTASPAGSDDNPNLLLRLRAAGGQWNDNCWGDNVLVTGTPGIATEPDISLSGSGNFGDVAIQTSSDQIITLSNIGDANLNIGTITGASTPFSLPIDNCSNQTLAPATQCTLTLRFAPTITGNYSGTLAIPSSDPDQPSLNLALNGNGINVSDNYDPLNGDGNVSRSQLTYNWLTNGNDPGSQVSMNAFAVPANAAQPINSFQGSLRLNGEATGGSFQEIRDDFDYTSAADTTRKHLPEFDFEFIQTGTHIFPLQRGSIPSSHPEWEYLLEPGRVWQENGDNGYSRVAIPFSLQQKNANCMHNGVMTFLFQGNSLVSKVAYQISSETCLYFKFDMWGLLDADYNGYSIANSQALKANYQAEVANRMPTKPISELATDYGADPSQFGHPSETDPDHMTVYGFVINGVNYVGGCNTRQGTYPYCEVLNLPSYSTAKSSFAGLALMRLEKQYPGVANQSIASQIPDCAANGNWLDVTLENTLDMATGNYDSSSYMQDEGAGHTNGLFLAEDHASKINYSCNHYNRLATPGSTWVYHTSDTYIVGRAMNNYLKSTAGSSQDIFTNTLVGDIWAPLNVSPSAKVSRRTYDSVAQPFAGWGLTYLHDDIAKLGQFLTADDGKINGQSVLDTDLYEAAMQRRANDRGLQAGGNEIRYNNGFWAYESSQILNCSNPTWVPFMSGFGGVTVLLMPNDTVYYYVSDNDTYLWGRAAIESNNISGYCQ